MAARSSSGSWSGAAGADVIDLDRFMRGVRPHRAPRDDHSPPCGGLSRKAPSSSSSGASTPRADARPHKHFSHDSGVSDGSYTRQRHRPHRRYSVAESAGIKAKRSPASSSGSMRAFRAACSRALRDQQRQLARVALLCERLERRERSDTERTERTKTDTSELSSSSRSTRDPRRKEKNRAQECKTYKIIMSKLDELNRVFASRRSPPRPTPRAPPSASSVSVSDKLVATDEPANKRGNKLVAPTQKVLSTKRVEMETRQLVERAVGESAVERAEHGRAEHTEHAEQAARAARLATLRSVNKAYALDIAPQEAVRKYPNIATESVVKRDWSAEGSRTTLCDARGFDLDDPIQLYAQAKRLQALHVSARRARSSERSERYERASPRPAPAQKSAEGVSLCALCREYWRAVRGYLTANVCCPGDDLPCACS